METLLIDHVRQAIADRTPLCIQAGGSKAFYGRHCQGEPLEVSGHSGDIRYEPSELVLTARAGTKLSEIEALLAANNQMLPFEPPHFSPAATLGGMVAAGLSGPRRPWGGSVRDAVLGVRLLNGRGEVLRLGGQVMKNVAGYDLSRLMVGALGTLGVLLEVSIKVLPRPAEERTLVFELDSVAAATRQIEWGRRPLPLSATLFQDARLHVRLSGSAQGVQAARAAMGGEEVRSHAGAVRSHAGAWERDIWAEVRDQTLALFLTATPLWRVSLPAAAPALPGERLTEWGGALRWLATDESGETLRQRVATLGGHATLFRGHDGSGEVFHPLPPAMLALHQRVKQALDPHGLFNPGKLYQGL
ncbi:MAG: glycolate oxidase subunit GlcE [Pseudomonadota bacterium]|nr:glycolate oxidase subunit GlcE [Pseudomonadota bacterium]